MTRTSPLVSVITPFFNTEAYLAECIESVLAQTYDNWEYILVDNRSTDSSRAIAERYGRRESRIRLYDTPRHLTQIGNYEGAVRRMSSEARYCKIVQADDRIFPECLARMVAVAESDPRIGIVSSYQLFGDKLKGEGLPDATPIFSGREICRRQLLRDEFYFGSPTSILVRAEIIRATTPFFDEAALHADTEACYRMLARYDMGFVHQVLTFSRTENDSISARARDFTPHLVDRYICVRKFGRQFLDEGEYRRCLAMNSSRYLRFLAGSVLEPKGEAFWRYHRHALNTVGCTFRSILRPRYVLMVLGYIACNPRRAAGRVALLVKKRLAKR